jgi:2-keto-4-pentenoate hydratase
MPTIRFAVWPSPVALLAAHLATACVPDARVEAVAAAWLAHEPQQSLADLDLDAARCFRQQLMDRLAAPLGPVVGYKVGVYAPAARKTYGVARPVSGVLRERMLLADGASVAVSAGVALLSEADFMLVIKDDGINHASTREQAYRHLRGYRPFIELPDGHYRPEAKPSLGQLVALDVNARLGVLGEEVPLPQTPAGFEGLANLAAEVTVEGAGEGLQSSAGVARQTLGDPLEIVLAARDVLREEGVQLKEGDLISIGTLTPPRPARAGEKLRVRYRGVTVPAEISMRWVR